MVEHEGLKIEDLQPAPYNPRQISDGAAEGLRYSMEEFGDLSGIVWNERTGHLVAGHQRVEQLKELGAVLHDGVLRGSFGEFPVRVVDWPEGKEKAANIAANNTHIAGEFTPDLASLLEEVQAFVGDEDFERLRLDALADGIPAPPVEVDEDEDTAPRIDGMTYSVIADFASEEEQARLLMELEERGIKCRLLTL